MSLSDKDVPPAVIVVVDHFRSPSRVRHCDFADANRVAHIVKTPFAVSEQRVPLICKGIDEGVRPAVVVIVAEVHSHAREGFSILIEGEAGFERHFRECSVVIIFKELLWERVIGYKDVRPSVAIKVVYCNPQRLAWRRCDAASLRDILESAVAVVVVNQARYGAKLIRVAIRTIPRTMRTAIDVPCKVPIKVPCDDQIQQPVSI